MLEQTVLSREGKDVEERKSSQPVVRTLAQRKANLALSRGREPAQNSSSSPARTRPRPASYSRGCWPGA